MIHVSQIYPCSKVVLASELYYICELGKYLKYNYGTNLSIDGVLLDHCLTKSDVWDYFRIALEEEWVVGSDIPKVLYEINIQNNIDWANVELKNMLFTTADVEFDRVDYNKRLSDPEFAIRTPQLCRVSFAEQNDTFWKWTIAGKDNKNFIDNNKNLNFDLARQAWVSLVAYVAIERFKTGRPRSLGIEFCSTLVANPNALSYIISLFTDTNCLRGWCVYTYADSVSEHQSSHVGYVSWYRQGIDLGYLNRWFSVKDKLAYMKEHRMEVGDVVFLYERAKAQKRNYLKSIAGCRMAIIREIKGYSVKLEVANTTKLYIQGKKDFDNHVTIIKQMYLEKPYESFNSTIKTFDLADLGVEYAMHSELYFIAPLTTATDSIITYITRDGGKTCDRVILNHLEYFYWLLKDYKIAFNENAYLRKYLKNKTPLYQQYIQTGVLDSEYYYIEEEDTY